RKQLCNTKYRYFLHNKPAGSVSATKDNVHQTVIDQLKGENTKDLFPVGRLDLATEGLLIITNDGRLAHHRLSPA
ncbi:pseudouridine synthase, partial [Coprococcus eutactus]|uniref:pseudouridine synthase n=1 Tax=Coprococcus eutactus TaxID=33043 RepID=UPI002109950A